MFLVLLIFLKLNRYLKASREKDLTSSVREGVDTLLMYLYRARNFVEEMESLASSENWCIVVWIKVLIIVSII